MAPRHRLAIILKIEIKSWLYNTNSGYTIDIIDA